MYSRYSILLISLLVSYLSSLFKAHCLRVVRSIGDNRKGQPYDLPSLYRPAIISLRSIDIRKAEIYSKGFVFCLEMFGGRWILLDRTNCCSLVVKTPHVFKTSIDFCIFLQKIYVMRHQVEIANSLRCGKAPNDTV